MATALEIAIDAAMSKQTMEICGQTVQYEMLSQAPKEIVMVIDTEMNAFADAGDVQLGEVEVTGRVQKTDISQPTKGDLITDAYGRTYSVRNWSQNALAEPEWSLALVKCDG